MPRPVTIEQRLVEQQRVEAVLRYDPDQYPLASLAARLFEVEGGVIGGQEGAAVTMLAADASAALAVLHKQRMPTVPPLCPVKLAALVLRSAPAYTGGPGHAHETGAIHRKKTSGVGAGAVDAPSGVASPGGAAASPDRSPSGGDLAQPALSKGQKSKLKKKKGTEAQLLNFIAQFACAGCQQKRAAAPCQRSRSARTAATKGSAGAGGAGTRARSKRSGGSGSDDGSNRTGDGPTATATAGFSTSRYPPPTMPASKGTVPTPPKPPKPPKIPKRKDRYKKDFLQSRPYEAFLALFKRWVREVVVPAVGDPDGILCQCPPTLRCSMPADRLLTRAHSDSDYPHHHAAELNFWLVHANTESTCRYTRARARVCVSAHCHMHTLNPSLPVQRVPLTRVSGSNSLQCESAPGRKDFHALEADGGAGEFVRFWGHRCRHFTVPNGSGTTRVSFDFRVVPLSLARPGRAAAAAAAAASGCGEGGGEGGGEGVTEGGGGGSRHLHLPAVVFYTCNHGHGLQPAADAAARVREAAAVAAVAARAACFANAAAAAAVEEVAR
jgi:hypothetical protein